MLDTVIAVLISMVRTMHSKHTSCKRGLCIKCTVISAFNFIGHFYLQSLSYIVHSLYA